MNLEKILDNHALWVIGNGGKRADLQGANLRGENLQGAYLRGAYLRGADLRGADLRGANLRGADLRGSNLGEADFRWANLEVANLRGAILQDATGNGKEIKSLQCGVYGVAYTATHLQIACEGHPIDDWWGFPDQRIARMDPGKSLGWWREWKSHLRGLIKESPAVPTGTEEAE